MAEPHLDEVEGRARTWSAGVRAELQASTLRAWRVASAATALALIQAFALASLYPLRSAVHFRITYDAATGYVSAPVVEERASGPGRVAAASAWPRQLAFSNPLIGHRLRSCLRSMTLEAGRYDLRLELGPHGELSRSPAVTSPAGSQDLTGGKRRSIDQIMQATMQCAPYREESGREVLMWLETS